MGRDVYNAIPPEPSLAGDIEEFFERRFEAGAVELSHCADHARIGLALSGNVEFSFPDGRRQRMCSPTIIGPSTRVSLVRMDGPVHIFGVVLKPPAWGDLCNGGCARLIDRAFPASALLGHGVNALAPVLSDAPDFETRVAIASAYARGLRDAAPMNAFNASFATVVDQWLASSERPRIETLVGMSHLSRRQVERLCKLLYGVPPRMLARRHRALRAAELLLRETNVDEVIGQGFYDQSHLIRELKHFTGLTPRRLGSVSRGQFLGTRF
ncbi:AraC-like DNA-binding protein [Sphingomonas jejuensis]|uniref:AraC-like DNA-binding protein n=1 Tax=Sphingomonas jejuensis TaxID=904715 RepID=A0ABX0XNU3_9SPHN|nr:AraC family transcriptional regulator [Sphingomonas jejuensis]NJC35051.1 AraC-like DNA-binding protein [Sphingomonas jejuensis]